MTQPDRPVVQDAVVTTGLGKRFGTAWAVQDCSITIPAGRVAALVGANGAGKTTLLRLLTGLASPTAGSAVVCGQPPRDHADFLTEIGYLAQDVPLYRRWTAEDHLEFGAHLNRRWDDRLARERLASLSIPLDRRVEALSGGMRAQVALALALAKRPRLLLLDEPLASLDPLARRSLLASIGLAVAEGDLTVILSSHLVTDLERVCDHLVLLVASHAVLDDSIDTVLATHRLLVATGRDLSVLERDHEVVAVERTPRQTKAVVRLRGQLTDPAWRVDELTLEDVVLAYLGREVEVRGGRAPLEAVS